MDIFLDILLKPPQPLMGLIFWVRKRLIKFADIVGILASNTFRESMYYSPSLLQMHQHECGDILYDIFMVSANLKHFFRCTDDFKDMNIGLRLVYTFSKQGSHSDWKTWKNGKAFSSQGKVREF